MVAHEKELFFIKIQRYLQSEIQKECIALFKDLESRNLRIIQMMGQIIEESQALNDSNVELSDSDLSEILRWIEGLNSSDTV